VQPDVEQMCKSGGYSANHLAGHLAAGVPKLQAPDAQRRRHKFINPAPPRVTHLLPCFLLISSHQDYNTPQASQCATLASLLIKARPILKPPRNAPAYHRARKPKWDEMQTDQAKWPMAAAPAWRVGEVTKRWCSGGQGGRVDCLLQSPRFP